jgi:LacI family transcriptional regulator
VVKLAGLTIQSRTRIKDIAKTLNVSIATVDRALHNRGRIDQKTKERILKTVEEFNYRPNILAQGFKKNRSYLVGLIIHGANISYFNEVIQGIEDVLISRNYSMILCTSNNKFDDEKKYISLLQDKSVDGMIILPSWPTTQQAIDCYTNLKQNNVPVVFIIERNNLANIPNVITNEYKGSVKMTEYLVKSGHKKIAYIKGPEDNWISNQRLQGYIDTMKTNNYLDYQDTIFGNGFTYENGYNSAKQILSDVHDVPTAIFACSDIAAIGAYKAIRETGLKIPGDISLAGYDDIDISSLIDVPLTTVAQLKYPIGQKSAEKLMQLIDSKNNHNDISDSSNDMVFEPELVIRESVKTI